MLEGPLTHDHRGRLRAPTDARHTLHPHPGRDGALQVIGQRFRAVHGAGEGIAHAHGQGGRWHGAIGQHIKVMIEGRHLEDLGLRQPHVMRQRGNHCCRQMPFGILDPMQRLDQQVP